MSLFKSKEHSEEKVKGKWALKREAKKEAKLEEKRQQQEQLIRDLEQQERLEIEFVEKQKRYQSVFASSRNFGDVELDDVNKLLKIHNATADIKKKKKSTDNVIWRYEDVINYDLYENNISVTGGGAGRAAIGTLIAGAAGGMMGAITGKRKQLTSVETMALHITMNDIFFPSVIIQFISKETKTKSKKYKEALSRAKEAISCLEIIMKYQDNNQEIEDKKNRDTDNNSADPFEQVKKAKELLDMGAITEEEFERKKNELLGL